VEYHLRVDDCYQDGHFYLSFRSNLISDLSFCLPGTRVYLCLALVCHNIKHPDVQSREATLRPTSFGGQKSTTPSSIE
jgi:hypothetical protein